MLTHFLEGAYWAFQHKDPLLASRRLLVNSTVCSEWTVDTAQLAVHEVHMPWPCRVALGDTSPTQRGHTHNAVIIHISALRAFFVSRKNCMWRYWATHPFTNIEQLRIIADSSHTLSSNDAVSVAPPRKKLRLKDFQDSLSGVDASVTLPMDSAVMLQSNGENCEKIAADLKSHVVTSLVTAINCLFP